MTSRGVTTVPQADAYLEARLHHHRTVEDVMTTAVVTVDRLTPYKATDPAGDEPRVSLRQNMVNPGVH